MVVDKGRIIALCLFLTIFSTSVLGFTLVQTQSEQPSFTIPNLLGTREFSAIDSFNQDLDDEVEMENLILNILSDQYNEYNLVGVTYAVVKNDSILTSGGYGYSDYATLSPVDPNNTLFRLASISKTFTAIAILQLMEDGLIDLDTDVNNYLTAFKIAETYDEPITIRHLLTHTAGFEETIFSNVFISEEDMPNLEETLTTDLAPRRVNPPGEVVSYSNYGYTLLGYIVQELTALPFEQYIKMEILEPLGLNHTTFEQPLPSSLEPDMATAYWEERELGFFEYVSISPAAALTSTAEDMSKFMIAMLNNATYNGTQILENSTIQMMQSEQFTTHPDLQGMCFGLYEQNMNGEYIIGHGGDTIFFHSRMSLFPEHDMGLFISYNNREGMYAKGDFFDEFVEHYFPYQNENIAPMENHDKDLKKYTGTYVSSRRYYSDAPEEYDLPKDYWITEASLSISRTGEYLTFTGSGLEFIQTSPDYFVERTGDLDFIIVFFEDEKGRITHFHSNVLGPTSTFEKIHYIYINLEKTFNPILLSFSIIFILALIYWGTKGIQRFVTTSESVRSLNTIVKWWTIGIPATILPYLFFVNQKHKELIFLAKEVPEIFGSNSILLILMIIFSAGQVILAAASWIEFKPSTIKARKEEQLGKEKSDEAIEEDSDALENQIKVEKKVTEDNKFVLFGRKLEKLLYPYQPILKRLFYTLLAIMGIVLVSLVISWNLLNIF